MSKFEEIVKSNPKVNLFAALLGTIVGMLINGGFAIEEMGAFSILYYVIIFFMNFMLLSCFDYFALKKKNKNNP